MICQNCGLKDAAVHLVERQAGQRLSLWLCADCAAARNTRYGGEDDRPNDFGAGGNPDETGDADSLASFLGKVELDGLGRNVNDAVVCPACGYTMELFRTSNRLGCAQCYRVFKAQLRPLLRRFHGHDSHLGKIPEQAGGLPSARAALTRARVALEKAIASENFEEAAQLRDSIRQLEDDGEDRPPEGA